MVIVILLLASIIAIYMTSENYIDLNSKISIYTIIIIFVIIATYLYYAYEVVERFTDLYSTYTGVASYQGAFSYDTQKVLLPLIRYIQTANNFITKVLSNSSTNNVNSVTGEIQTHVNNYIADRRSKKDTYNKKYNALKSSTELIIKNITFYKSIMMLISFIMVLLLLTVILYLLFPQFAMVILVAVLIPLIISIGITVYYLSRSTRSRENKKYWANMNPTDAVLKKLN
jgi:hypothetical protein